MKTPDPSDPLARALSDWRLTPQRNPEFRTAVWARLKPAAGTSSWTTYARAHVALVAGAIAFAMLAGAVTGREKARARLEAESDRLANSYVQSMDARTMRLP